MRIRSSIIFLANFKKKAHADNSMRTNNYSKMQENARVLFLTYDQNEILLKSFVSADEDFLYVTVLGTQYRVDRKSGDVLLPDGSKAGFDAALTVYDLLTHKSSRAFPSGNYCILQSLDSKSRVNSGTVGGYNDSFAKKIDEDPKIFKNACLALGRECSGKGDLNYEFELFDGLCFRLCFWASDDEFPPQLIIYADENILEYILFETAYYAAGLLMDCLEKLLVF